MRNILCIAMLMSFALLFGCQTASSSSATASENKSVVKTEDSEPKADSHDPEAGVKRISLADAKKAFDKGEAFFIDTRSAAAFTNEHIEGAINMPSSQVEDRYQEIPKDKTIVVYCS